jgi:hypothetical protein
MGTIFYLVIRCLELNPCFETFSGAKNPQTYVRWFMIRKTIMQYVQDAITLSKKTVILM